jgi:carbon monoxide dehydrogenase subunit G
MTEFKSKQISISKPADFIFSYLDDFNNFENLLPEQVTNWQATKDNCSFTIQGMADLKIKKGTKSEFTHLSYTSEGNKPFEFALHFHFHENAESNTESHIIFEAKLNPMVKMMASRPLQNLVEIMVEKLKEEMEK